MSTIRFFFTNHTSTSRYKKTKTSQLSLTLLSLAISVSNVHCGLSCETLVFSILSKSSLSTPTTEHRNNIDETVKTDINNHLGQNHSLKRFANFSAIGKCHHIQVSILHFCRDKRILYMWRRRTSKKMRSCSCYNFRLTLASSFRCKATLTNASDHRDRLALWWSQTTY